GVIKPKRDEDNNYRVYDTMDYFALSEAKALSRFNVNVKDIYELKAVDYCNELSNCYRKFISDTEKEIEYKSLLKDRAKELLNRIDNAEVNIGNMWVKYIPPYRIYPLMKSHNDDYGKMETPEHINTLLNSSKVIPFGDGMIECEDGYEQWWMAIDKRYVDILSLPSYEESMDVEGQYCVCIILNMGDIGEFNSQVIRNEILRIEKMNYHVIGKPRGLLLCRGSKHNEFRRLLELQIPIRKL
ncbi:MAG: hypothetical protein MR500_03470, partial [Erysipelotrichaceae bacterium]|nr:hypothetical protein [Erysipelotrichaceae bacterium]